MRALQNTRSVSWKRLEEPYLFPLLVPFHGQMRGSSHYLLHYDVLTIHGPQRGGTKAYTRTKTSKTGDQRNLFSL